MTEGFDDGKQFAGLNCFINAIGVSERGLRAEINDVSALFVQHFSTANGAVGRKADAFAIP